MSVHVFWYSRDYRVGTTGLLANFVGSRKFPGKQYIQQLFFKYLLNVLFAGHWTSSRCTDPYGCWEYLHQGGGRRVHKENLELLTRLEPIVNKCESTNPGSYCPRSTYANPGGLSPSEGNPITSTAMPESTVAGSSHNSSKIFAGRRIANLFIESGKADVSGLRQWITAQPALRKEFEALL